MNVWRGHFGAAALYAALSWFVLADGHSLTHSLYGLTSDPLQFVWLISWWPYALSHHLYPLTTTLVWQPVGLNLAWTTSIPLPALLAAPLTLTAGPIVTYNVLMLLAPFGAALATYTLCWRLTRVWVAAIVGGYLFGFSSYEAVHSLAHINLVTTLCLPLSALLLLERLSGRLGRGGFVALGGVLLAAQFAISTEVFATSALIGALAAGLAWALMPDERARLVRLLPEVAGAGLGAAVLVSPLLYALFALPSDIHLPAHWPEICSTDLLNLIIPTPISAVGGAVLVEVSSKHLHGFVGEQVAYLGLALLALLVLALHALPQVQARFYGTLLGCILVLSLGPVLWIGGVRTGVPMPWALVEHVPLLGSALPGRLMVYAALLSAVLVSRYVAQGRGRMLALMAVLSLLPTPHGGSPVPYSTFFAPGEVTRVLGPAPRLLVLPPGITGATSYWQAESGFAYAQTAGYLGYPPGAVQGNLPIMRLYFGLSDPNLAPALAAWCAATHTQYVVVAQGTPNFAWAALAALRWPRHTVDDVTIFTVP